MTKNKTEKCTKLKGAVYKAERSSIQNNRKTVTKMAIKTKSVERIKLTKFKRKHTKIAPARVGSAATLQRARIRRRFTLVMSSSRHCCIPIRRYIASCRYQSRKVIRPPMPGLLKVDSIPSWLCRWQTSVCCYES